MSDATTFDLAAIGTQLAQAAGEPIGSVVSSNGDISITRASGETIDGTQGVEIFANDTVVTGPGASIGFEFIDFSTFSLGESAQIIIDELVYDPGADSSMVVNLVAGTFSFVSGEIAKSGDDSMQIITPVATIGIRGTAGAGDPNSVALLQETGQPLGEISYATQSGAVTLTQANQLTGANDPFANPNTPTIVSIDQIQANFGSALQELPVSLPANENIRRPGAGNTNQNDDEEGGEDGDAEEDGEDAAEGESEGGEETAEGEGTEGEGEEEVAAEGEEEVAEGEGEGEEVAEGEEAAEGEGEEGEDVAAADQGPADDGGSLYGGGFGGGAIGGVPQGGGPPGGGIGGDPQPEQVVALPPPPPPPPPPAVTPPPPPPPEDNNDVVIDEGGDDGGDQGGEQGGGIQEFLANGTVTLTGGNDDVRLGAASITVDVLGTAQAGDTFTDSVPGVSEQTVSFIDDAAHQFSVDGIEEVTFGTLSNSIDATVIGTGPVSFVGEGSFDIDITGDASNNFVTLTDGQVASFNADVSLGGGTDTLTLESGAPTTVTVTDTEVVQTFGAPNSITFTGGTLTLDSSGGGGPQDVIFQTGTTLTWLGSDANISSTTFSAGDDRVNFEFQVNGGNFDGLGGADTFDFSGGAGRAVGVNLSNFENFIGGSNNDGVISLTGLVSGSNFAGGAGTDSLTLEPGGNTASITEFESIATSVGGTDDNLTFEDAVSGVTVNLQGGSDNINLANTNNDLSVAAVSSVTGGAGNDILTLLDSTLTDADLGGGANDTINLNASSSIAANIFNTEFINGQVGTSESLSVTNDLIGATVNLGVTAGDDLILNGGGANSVDIIDINSVIGGAGNDSINFLGSGAGTVDLGGGIDQITVGSSTSNFGAVFNVENFIGGSGDDTVTLALGLVSGDNFDGGAESVDDILNLTGITNHAGSITDFETINVTVASSTVTLENADSGNQQFFFTAGSNTLNLASGTNIVTVFNSADAGISVFGNAGDDTVNLLASYNGALIDLGVGTDTVDASASGGLASTTLQGVEFFTASGLSDSIIVSSGLASGSTYDGGGGFDVIDLLGSTNTGSISGFEEIAVGVANGTLTLENTTNENARFSFTAGVNTLTLAAGNNTVSVDAEGGSGLINVVAGAGDDLINLQGSHFGSSFDLGAGNDTVQLEQGAFSSASFTGVETVLGTIAGVENLTVENTVIATTFDIGTSAGDNITFTSGGNNDATFANVHQVISTGGDDNFVFTGTGAINVDMAGGNDTLEINSAGSTFFAGISNVENLTGSAFDDFVIMETGLTAGSIFNGGTGIDVLQLDGLTNASTIFDFEFIKATVNSATVTVENASNSNQEFLFSGGTNALNLADGGNIVTFNSEAVGSADTITGGINDDAITVVGDFLSSTINLDAGIDDVDASGANSFDATLIGVESFLGSTNDDTVILGSSLVSGDNYDGGGFSGPGDTLQLFGAINTAIITNFNSINVTTQNATVTLELGDTSNQTFTFTGGSNTLDLGSFDQVVTVDSDLFGVSDVTILGGAGNQNVTVTGSIVSAIFNLGDGVDTMTGSTDGSDTFIFEAASHSLVATPDTITNFDATNDAEDIDFSAFAFSSFSFIGSGNFTANGTVEARFDDATDTLQVDTNDDGSTDMAIVLTGVNGIDLDANDFTV